MDHAQVTLILIWSVAVASATVAGVAWLLSGRDRDAVIAPGQISKFAELAITWGATFSETRGCRRWFRALRSGFEFRKEREQIATQPAAVAARDPGGARPIECLDEGSAGATGLTGRYSDLLRRDTR
jgi:hypothetical protein